VKIETFTAPGFEENTYLVRGAEDAAVVIDPGANTPALLERIEQEGIAIHAVLLTHAHIDHIEGVAKVVRQSNAPVYLHEDDRRMYEAAPVQALQFGLRVDPLPSIDHELRHGQRLDLIGLRFEVRHVPGHSPGHVLFYLEKQNVAFVGDVVFQGSIGRTDLPGGNYTELMRSIRQQVLTLPANTELYSGHGPPTTVAHERDTNPFLIPNYGGGLA